MRTMEECLEQRGIRTRGLGNSMIVRQALEYRGEGTPYDVGLCQHPCRRVEQDAASGV